jgi:hypothetical protein
MENDTNLGSGYAQAYELACRSFGKKDPEEIANNAGCLLDRETGTFTIRFLAELYWVKYPGGEIGRVGGDTSVAVTIKVLIMHYLINSTKTELTGTLISFLEVEGGGENYYPVFQKRAELPLGKTFGLNPKMLIHCGLRLGGRVANFGDASIHLPVFPNVHITYVVWKEEDGMPSTAAILFDSSINSYLPCEDIVQAASMGVYALIYELQRQLDQISK